MYQALVYIHYPFNKTCLTVLQTDKIKEKHGQPFMVPITATTGTGTGTVDPRVSELNQHNLSFIYLIQYFLKNDN